MVGAVLQTLGSTNSLTVTLSTAPSDVVASGAIGGPPITLTTTVGGQKAEVNFLGNIGQKMSVLFSNNSFNQAPSIDLVNPDLSVVNYFTVFTPDFIDTSTLPANGTYSICVQCFLPANPQAFGSITVTLYNVVDVVGSISLNGSSLPITTNTPGQNAEITFSGTAGQSVTVQLSNNSICTAQVSLLPPGGGNALTSTSTCSANFSLPSQTLPTTGTYTILVDPQSSATGTITVAVTTP